MIRCSKCGYSTYDERENRKPCPVCTPSEKPPTSAERGKVCTRCKKEFTSLLRYQFYEDRRRPDGLDSCCKACRNGDRARRLRGGGNTARSRRMKERNPEKVRAREAVHGAVRDGKIKRGQCHCGEVKVEAHHTDYSKPLDVMWLCKKHHMEQHRKERSMLRQEVKK